MADLASAAEEIFQRGKQLFQAHEDCDPNHCQVALARLIADEFVKANADRWNGGDGMYPVPLDELGITDLKMIEYATFVIELLNYLDICMSESLAGKGPHPVTKN